VKCFECDAEAIGVCRWCKLGQCEEHMRAGLEARKRIPSMGCIHMFTGGGLLAALREGESTR